MAREHLIKQSSFLSETSWTRHIVDLAKREKIVYLRRLPHRFAKISGYLLYIRHFSNIYSCNSFIRSIKPVVVLVDDKLHDLLAYKPKVKESRVKERHRKVLIILADNVAYYAYWVIGVRRKPQLLQQILK